MFRGNKATSVPADNPSRSKSQVLEVLGLKTDWVQVNLWGDRKVLSSTSDAEVKGVSPLKHRSAASELGSVLVADRWTSLGHWDFTILIEMHRQFLCWLHLVWASISQSKDHRHGSKISWLSTDILNSWPQNPAQKIVLFLPIIYRVNHFCQPLLADLKMALKVTEIF